MTYLYQVQKYQYDITQLPSCKTFSKRKEKHCAACLHPGLIDPVIFPVCLLLPSHKEELTKTSTIRHEENYFFTKQIYPACDSFLYSIHLYFDNGFFFFLKLHCQSSFSLSLDVLCLVTLPFVAMEIDARGCRASVSVLGKSLNGTWRCQTSIIFHL